MLEGETAASGAGAAGEAAGAAATATDEAGTAATREAAGTAASSAEADTRRRRLESAGKASTWSERDGPLLRVVGEQYALSIPQLARLIGRRERTGRALRDRWARAGWVESRPLTVGDGPLLWLTPAGGRRAGSPYRRWKPNGSMVAHITAVTEVRLLAERELRLGVWTCERELARRAASRALARPHLPDGVLRARGERVAIEVELSLKSRSRLAAIVEELAFDYDRVWYFAAGPALRALREIAPAVPWDNVAVYTYPPNPAELPR